MELNKLSDNQGARGSRKRVGRGEGSGTGKTSGKGQKGQKSRSGVSIKGFEGGQMPLYRRLPKRGFTNIFRKKYAEVSLERLQKAVDAGKLDVSKTIDGTALVKAGVIRRIKDGVRILGNGELKAKLTLDIAGATKSAIAAIEAAGGKVVLPAVQDLSLKLGKKAERKTQAVAKRQTRTNDTSEPEVGEDKSAKE
ncbi:MAG: 50S ribosomal protein L15 [Rhodospirillaceae bacterium]|nr:50S ribosomal protein L15 [Rhodospirillaceae bacterium]